MWAHPYTEKCFKVFFFFSPAFKYQPRVPWVQTHKKRETWQNPLLAFTKLYTKTQASNISIIKIAASLPKRYQQSWMLQHSLSSYYVKI